MAWTQCERFYGMASQISFPHPPNQFFPLRLPNSFPKVLTAAPNFLPVLVGGGRVGVVTIAPSRTSTSSVIYISSTRVTTKYAKKFRAVPVVLYFQVSGTFSPAPVPVFSVGSLISATIEISLP